MISYGLYSTFKRRAHSANNLSVFLKHMCSNIQKNDFKVAFSDTF